MGVANLGRISEPKHGGTSVPGSTGVQDLVAKAKLPHRRNHVVQQRLNIRSLPSTFSTQNVGLKGLKGKMAKILLFFKLAKLVETKVVVFQVLKIRIKTPLL